MNKSELRQVMRERLSALSIHERQNKSLLISNTLKQLSFLPGTLGVYAPLEEEVDWSLSFGDEVFLYVAFKDKEHITFYPSRKMDLKDLVWNNRTFKIPSQSVEMQPKVILVPGLAMTPAGARLGRGGGFYDRYLENFTGLKIGLTFNCCLVESLPMDEHDQFLDWIVTESGIKKIRRQEWGSK